MPDTLRKDLIDQVRSLIFTWVDARPSLLGTLRSGNRITDTEEGRQRMVSRALFADFGWLKVEVETLGHSGWSQARSIAAQKNSYKDDSADFTVLRDVRLVVTVGYMLPKRDAQENAANQQASVKDVVVDALFAAGPQLGLSYVQASPTFKVEDRDTRQDEKPYPGKIATITTEFQCQQSGRALLTAINTIS